MKIPVHISATASNCIGEVDIERPEDFDDAADALWKNQGYEFPTLCHQCAHEIDLGDFEIDDSNLNYYFPKDSK